jgi:hypothetical protein
MLPIVVHLHGGGWVPPRHHARGHCTVVVDGEQLAAFARVL